MSSRTLMIVDDEIQRCELLGLHPDLQTTPIIATTRLCGRGDRERRLAAGCDDYVAKPFTLQQLQQRLVSILQML